MFILIASFLTTLLVKIYIRPNYSGSNHFYKLLLDSLPNFFAVFGSAFMYPLFKGTISFKEHFNTTLFITLGVLAYEIEQYWTKGTFDYLDIGASIAAALISIALYKNLFLNRIYK